MLLLEFVQVSVKNFLLSPSKFFSMRFASVHVVHSYNRIDTAAAWKKFRFILSDWSDFHVIDNQSTPLQGEC